MKRVLVLACLLLSVGAAGLPYPDYGASALQRKVDLSFSAIPIDTPFKAAQARLRKVPEACDASDECQWRDAGGTRHYFWGDFDDNPLVIKFVRAAEFKDHPIHALGIGKARTMPEVIKAVRAFDRRIKLDCSAERVSGNVGPQECSFTTEPGWVQMGFDRKGRLLMLRFDGYQFI